MPDDLLETVKAALDDAESFSPKTYPGRVLQTDHDHRAWLRALVARCEQAEADLAALRQRHPEAVEAAFREGFHHMIFLDATQAWLASEAKARLT